MYSDQQDSRDKFINVADKVGKKITLSIDNSLKGTDYLYSIFIDKDGNHLTPWLIVGQDENTKRKTLTVPATAVKLTYPMIRLQNESGTYSGESYHYQIEFGDNATEITPYEDLGEITVSNDTSTPVYGLKAADGVTNILTDYGAEITVDYPKTLNGQYALSSAKTASDNATAIAANAIKSVEIKGTTNDWGILNIQELLSFPTTRIINVATTSADYITTMATSSEVRVISVLAPGSPAAVANTEVTLKIIYV